MKYFFRITQVLDHSGAVLGACITHPQSPTDRETDVVTISSQEQNNLSFNNNTIDRPHNSQNDTLISINSDLSTSPRKNRGIFMKDHL